jgi:hypothetical protein
MDPNVAHDLGRIHEECVPNEQERDMANDKEGILCAQKGDCDKGWRDAMSAGKVK